MTLKVSTEGGRWYLRAGGWIEGSTETELRRPCAFHLTDPLQSPDPTVWILIVLEFLVHSLFIALASFS